MSKLVRSVLCRFAVLAMLLALPAVVESQSYTNNYGIWPFTTNNGTITIMGYTGPGGVVTIPSRINGLPVTSIGDFAFRTNAVVTTVTIPDSVTSIGDNAFSYCYSLADVTIPNSVTNIGKMAFAVCMRLRSVTIPNSVTSIENGAFRDCTTLTSVSIGNGVTSIAELAFWDCSWLPSVTIPNSVTNIGDQAFGYCSSLANVTIGNSVTNIGRLAFEYCSSLTNVMIGNSVTNIGQQAFWQCSRLPSVTIPKSVTTIWDSAFGICTCLASLFFEGNAPLALPGAFSEDNNAIVYYLPDTTGWGATFGGRPTALWSPHVQTTDASFGVRSNQFGFNINWASGMTVVVEASTTLANPTWTPLATNTLSGGSSYFSDPQWTQDPRRFYRLRWP